MGVAGGATGRALKAALAFVALAAVIPAGATAHVDRIADRTDIRGSIRYVGSYSCNEKLPRPAVEGATIFVKRGRAHADKPLESGQFDVQLGGSGPITAYVELKSDFATIKPFGATNPYRIPVKLHPGANDVRIIRTDQGAAANVATEIDHAARFAHDVLPAGATLPPVTVLLRYTTNFSHDETSVGPTHYDPNGPTIEIDNDPENRTYPDEWEQSTILHEYGHHVLWSLANPGERAVATHEASEIYPNLPGLAWSEGFADAFPALVTGKPQITRDCKVLQDLAATPATPSSTDRVVIDQAQYNETQAAGVIWHLVTLHGQSRQSRAAGTSALLTAARAFKARPGAGHYPQSMREVRDALVGSPLEPDTLAGHDAIEKVFADDHMGWGIAFDIEDTDNETTTFGQYLHLSLSSPYGTCEDPRSGVPGPIRFQEPLDGVPSVTWDGGVVHGPLGSTWRDDCLIASGPAQNQNPGGLENHGVLNLFFPYLDKQRHASAPFKLYGTFKCDELLADPKCTGAYTYFVTFFRGWVLNPDQGPPQVLNTTAAEIEGRTVFINVPLELREGVETEILSFDAKGTCEIVPIHQNCTV
jgi:hypothetical protein